MRILNDRGDLMESINVPAIAGVDHLLLRKVDPVDHEMKVIIFCV